MTNRPNDQHPIEKLVDEVEFRQRNTTWPDVMINSSSADELMWKGSRRITKVQRVGVALFGLFFVLGSVSFASIGGGGRWIMIAEGTGFILVGCKLLWNSIRRNEPIKPAEEDD